MARLSRLFLLVLAGGLALPAAAQRARPTPRRRPAPRPMVRPAPKPAPPAPAAARPQPVVTGFSGTVEAFNTRTMMVEVRGADGRLYLADARNAQFAVRVRDQDRPAEFIDLRPGARVEVQGTRSEGQMTAANLVRINELPARGRTLDPFTAAVASAGPTSTPSSVPRAGELRGVIRGIDRSTRILRLRSAGQEIPVRYTLTTSWEGINARSANAGYLRPGDRVRIEGQEFMGEWTAERIVLEPPAGQG